MKQKKKLSTGLFVLLMLLPSMCFLCVFTIYPLTRGAVMAFQNYNLFNLSDVHFVGLENFKELFDPSPLNNFPQIIKNTIKWVVVSVFFQLMLGMTLALLLRKPFKGQAIYRGIVFFPWAISGFIIGIMWRWMFNGTSGVINDLFLKIGFINQPIGWLSDPSMAMNSVIVANIWYGIPFFTIMITAAMAGISEDMYEAAEVDGGGALVKFWYITLPEIKPVLLLTVLLRVIWVFNFPELVYSMTDGGPGDSTHIITSYMMNKIMSLDYGMGSAIGVVVILVLSVFASIYLWLTERGEEGND